ncbi:MAG: hypothetical protein VB084_09115 [Syntrophomonadaceae bacterium]|nr:hypothetical protein [Syntrophomonadaceae bacterium]
MRKSIELIKTMIPPEYPGNSFVKRVKVFVPYKELGINILERSETRLSLVYETVLKLLDLGQKDAVEMSENLGIDFNIFREILAELSFSNLLSSSDMKLVLTNKGKEALHQLKNISIKRAQMNRIFVNTITGSIELEEQYVSKINYGSMCLNFDTNYDIDFLRKQFNTLESIYFRSRKNEYDELSLESKKSTLYRLIDLEYQESRYKVLNCFVYLNDDDKSLSVIFDKDTDGVLANVLLQQINGGIVDVQYLFERNREFIDYYKGKDKVILDSTMLDNLKDFLQAVELKSKGALTDLEIESYYNKDRYLLDGEINEIFADIKYYNPKEIIISSPRMLTFLQNYDIKDLLFSSQKNTKIKLIYNSNEYRLGNQIEWIKSNIKNHENIVFIDSQDKLTKTTIVFSPSFVINSEFELYCDNKLRFISKEISCVSFDYKKVQQHVASLK